MLSSQTVGELAKALSAVQSKMGIAMKDKANPFFKSKYADLQTCWGVVRPFLAEHGLAVVQLPGGDGTTITVQTTVLHASGEWLADEGLRMTPVKADPQGVASAITYGRRYGLMAVLGIVADEDDDGEASVGRSGGGSIDDGRSVSKPTQVKAKPIAKPKASEKAADATVEVKEVTDQGEVSVDDPKTVSLLASLTVIKSTGGWNAKSHRDNWQQKHKQEFDALSIEDGIEVNKLFLSVPFKAAKEIK